MLNTKTLMYLVALADTGHFGQAARICHVTQPTLSIQIGKMEEYLNTKLLDRSGNKIALTQKGLQVVSIARSILTQTSLIKAIALVDPIKIKTCL